jgi:hypothetical protein
VEQLKLFDLPAPYQVQRPPTLVLSPGELQDWKARVAGYQSQCRAGVQPRQTTLWGTAADLETTPDQLDPFTLPCHSALFWRQSQPWAALESEERGCLYFVLDREASLLLYIGETRLSARQRWQGAHDCKEYILRYLELHRRYDQSATVVSAFWRQAPTNKRALRQWERQLILKWRSPFNKECWQWWGQPFGKKAV